MVFIPRTYHMVKGRKEENGRMSDSVQVEELDSDLGQTSLF